VTLFGTAIDAPLATPAPPPKPVTPVHTPDANVLSVQRSTRTIRARSSVPLRGTSTPGALPAAIASVSEPLPTLVAVTFFCTQSPGSASVIVKRADPAFVPVRLKVDVDSVLSSLVAAAVKAAVVRAAGLSR